MPSSVIMVRGSKGGAPLRAEAGEPEKGFEPTNGIGPLIIRWFPFWQSAVTVRAFCGARAVRNRPRAQFLGSTGSGNSSTAGVEETPRP